MNALTLEWVDKAEGDLVTAERELRARKLPNYDSACFHAQQMAEKYLKAFLQEQGSPFPKTHHLVSLLELCAEIDVLFNLHEGSLIALDGYAIRFRYPGDSADKSDAKNAVANAKIIREFVRARLGL